MVEKIKLKNNEIGIERERKALMQMFGYYLGRMISYPLVPPEHVYFSLTNRCNLKCKMCDIDKTPAVDRELSASEIEEIIIQIKELGIRHLILSGGEPLLRGDLTRIAEFASKHNLGRIDIITNGTLFNSQLIEDLLKINLNHITFSIDGLKKTNDVIRGEGSFDKAINNIRQINDYKAKKNLLLPTVGINFTVMDCNINQILPMINFTKEIGCNCIIFQPLLSNNIKMFEKHKNDFWPSDKSLAQLEKVMLQVIRLKEMFTDFEICTDKEILDCMPEYFRISSAQWKLKCYEAIKRIVIGYDGKVWSCAGIYGDLKKQSLREVWYSKEAENIRNIVRQCSEHCLQDCVHVPLNLLFELKLFWEKVESMQDKEKADIRETLLEQLAQYENILSSKSPSFSSNSCTTDNIEQGIDSLNLIKEVISK
jgi:MoaA/NifB/PqqE/SkfB family radical SAM enzyme